MPELETRLTPDSAQISGALKKMQRQVGDLSVPNKKTSVYLSTWVLRNFKTQGKNVGGWAKFALGGRMVNGKLDTTAELLKDTDRLRDSFLPFYGKAQAGIGSDVPYSKRHNEGEGKLPARRMLPTITEIWPKVEPLYAKYVSDALSEWPK